MHIGIQATIGVISDTHGLLHPCVPEFFDGVDLIVHAGDIGGLQVLIELEAIAPVVAVRGNTDHGPWATGLPLQASFSVGTVRGIAVHDLAGVELPASTEVVVSGHTHRAIVKRRDGVLYVNPGSASHSRPRTGSESVALVSAAPDGLTARIVRL